MTQIIKAAGKHAIALGLAAGVGFFLIAFMWSLNSVRIEEQRQSEKERLMLETLFGIDYDKPPMLWRRDLPIELPAATVRKLWRVTQAEDVVAVVVFADAKNGYNGIISVMMSFTAKGLHDLRVVHHRETPGVADFLNDGDRSMVDGVSGATISTAALGGAARDLWDLVKFYFDK